MSAQIALEALRHGQRLPCRLDGERLVSPLGEVQRSQRVLVVLVRGKMRQALAVKRLLKRLGYSPRVMRDWQRAGGQADGHVRSAR